MRKQRPVSSQIPSKVGAETKGVAGRSEREQHFLQGEVIDLPFWHSNDFFLQKSVQKIIEFVATPGRRRESSSSRRGSVSQGPPHPLGLSNFNTFVRYILIYCSFYCNFKAKGVKTAIQNDVEWKSNKPKNRLVGSSAVFGY